MITIIEVYKMDSGSGSNIGGHDPAWKYCTPIEGNINGTICNFCGMVIKSGGITTTTYELLCSGYLAAVSKPLQ